MEDIGYVITDMDKTNWQYTCRPIGGLFIYGTKVVYYVLEK